MPLFEIVDSLGIITTSDLKIGRRISSRRMPYDGVYVDYVHIVQHGTSGNGVRGLW